MSDTADLIRLTASQYSGVDLGTSCTQSSFKIGGTAFLYLGEQGGRYKAMFKLKNSRAEAEALAKRTPEDFQVGTGHWVTARFSDDAPLPKRIWKKWLDESYALSAGENPATLDKLRKKTSTKTKRSKV